MYYIVYACGFPLMVQVTFNYDGSVDRMMHTVSGFWVPDVELFAELDAYRNGQLDIDDDTYDTSICILTKETVCISACITNTERGLMRILS